MTDQHVKRLAADLSAIRQAIRFDKPYAADDVRIMLLLAVGGAMAIPLVEFTRMDNRVCFLLALAPAIALCVYEGAQRRRDRAARPGLWREIKLTLVVSAIGLPLALGWLYWSWFAGMSWFSAGGAVMFFIGVGLTVIGFIDENRRSYLAGGFVLMAYGLAVPWLSPRQVTIAGAAALIVTGLGGAAIIWRQLKRDVPRQPGSGQLT